MGVIKIIEEVRRHQQLMYGKSILSEQGLVGKIVGLAQDFLARTEKKVVQGTGNRMIGGVELTSRQLDDIEAVIADPSLINALSSSEIRLLGKILLQSDDIVEKSYEEVIQQFLKLNPDSSEKKLIQAITDAMESENKTVSEVLMDMTGDELATTILTRKVSKKIDELKKGTFKVEVVPKLSDKPKFLSADEIFKFNKIIQNKTAKVFIQDVSELFKKDLDTLKKEIYELSKGFEQEILGKTGEELTELVNAYAVAISRKLDLIEIKANNAAADILENSGLSQEIVNKLKSSDDAFFRVFRDARAADSQSLFTILTNSVKDFLIEIKELVLGIFKKEGNTLLKALNPTTSIGQWFYTAQWATFSKLWKLAIKTSASQNKLKYIAAAAFASAVGNIVGTTFAGVISGLNQLVLLGNYNKLVDVIAGEDGTIFGKPKEDFQAELGSWTEEKNIILKTLNAVLEQGWYIIQNEFEQRGLLSALLTMVPGGVLTYDNSLFSKIYSSVVAGEDYMPSLRKGIYEMLGTTEEEVNDNIKKVEDEVKNTDSTESNTPSEIPTDLKDLMGVNQEQIKIKEDGSLYWGTEDYPVEKRGGVWKVYFPEEGWYLVTDMNL